MCAPYRMQVIRVEKFQTSNENCGIIVNNEHRSYCDWFCFGLLNQDLVKNCQKKHIFIGLTFEARSLLKLV